ncbi:MAG TPA: hypothetical protein PKD83_04100, partial [Ignavibacteria bacterium]|nr:hypothetical protein [Ignavibacteria bacterium]
LKGILIISVAFMDGYGNVKTIFVTDEMGVRFENMEKAGSVFLKIPELLLRADNYSIKLFAGLDGTGTENVLDSVENAVNIQVLPGDFWKTGKQNRAGSYGLMNGQFYK